MKLSKKLYNERVAWGPAGDDSTLQNILSGLPPVSDGKVNTNHLPSTCLSCLLALRHHLLYLQFLVWTWLVPDVADQQVSSRSSSSWTRVCAGYLVWFGCGKQSFTHKSASHGSLEETAYMTASQQSIWRVVLYQRGNDRRPRLVYQVWFSC